MKTIVTTSIFDRWFDGLKNRTDKARIEVRIRRAESGNFGDVSLWAKAFPRCGFTAARATGFIHAARS